MQWSSKECLLPLYTKLLTGEGQRKTVEIKNGNASYLLIQISTKYRMECTKQHYLFYFYFFCVIAKQATVLSCFLLVWLQSKPDCDVAHNCFHVSYLFTPTPPMTKYLGNVLFYY